MGATEVQRWAGEPGRYGRTARVGGRFEAYVPDRLVGREFDITSHAVSALEDAAGDLGRLEATADPHTNTEALARLLLRAEAVGSSQIEGLVIGARRLLKAEAVRDAGRPDRDVTAHEVLGNIDAMTWAVETVQPGDEIELDHVLETHRRLLEHTPISRIGGQMRTEQNWIGGGSPLNAVYVPPPVPHVRPLLDDLVTFINSSQHSVLTKAAIAHAQFETIHPFADGNGRTGRALIHMILRAAGVTERSLPPISLSLATHAEAYIGTLTAFRYDGPPTSSKARAAANPWLEMFATACSHAVDEVGRLSQTIAKLRTEWHGRVAPVRSNSTVRLLLDLLPAAPVLTADGAAKLTQRSLQSANEALGRLVEAGILKQVTVGRRNRAFEATELIDAFTLLERRFASPAADTLIEPPSRLVPSAPRPTR